MKKIAIFGAGGFGREVKWLIEEINAAGGDWEFAGFFDDDFTHAKYIDQHHRLGGTDALNEWKEEIWLVFAIGNPLVKRKIFRKINNPNIKYPVLVHPNVRMGAGNVEVGKGSIICAGNIITVDIRIGRHVI